MFTILAQFHTLAVSDFNFLRMLLPRLKQMCCYKKLYSFLTGYIEPYTLTVIIFSEVQAEGYMFSRGLYGPIYP